MRMVMMMVLMIVVMIMAMRVIMSIVMMVMMGSMAAGTHDESPFKPLSNGLRWMQADGHGRGALAPLAVGTAHASIASGRAECGSLFRRACSSTTTCRGLPARPTS